MYSLFADDPSVKHRLVAENTYAYAFLNRMPIVPGHILICPKRTIVTSEELTPSEWADILALKNQVCVQLKKHLGAEGFNFAWNEGSLAGQSVPHFHLHILPRKSGDTGITEYEPRVFLYRPEGPREIAPEEELLSLAVLLKT